MEKRLLEIENLGVTFRGRHGAQTVVAGVSLDLQEGATLGIVGESGSGKSITSLAIMGLLPPGGTASGCVRFQGRDLLQLPKQEMRKLRGQDVAMVFQEPMTSLNPAYTIGNQLMEPIFIHLGLNRSDARHKAVELLEMVEIPRPTEVLANYPHQLSGGMRQRVMIAMALSCNPTLLIADEPTTALDVTIQAQILELIRKIRERDRMATMLITHDLGVIAEMCERVIVMYAGKIVEEAPVRQLFRDPQHPYTRGLLQSMPRLRQKGKLYSIRGNVPTPDQMPLGCRFVPRCDEARQACWEQQPPVTLIAPGHTASCWQHVKEAEES
ncbi:MAG: ABC transporter ATP-binding protein [Desulfitobacteriaceae bacterium]